MNRTDTEPEAADVAAEDHLRSIYEDSATVLVSVRKTLALMLRDLAESDGNPKDIVAKHKELQTALIRTQETEQKYYEWKSKRNGGAGRGNDDFDLAAARHQIGCRLARLRECCRES